MNGLCPLIGQRGGHVCGFCVLVGDGGVVGLWWNLGLQLGRTHLKRDKNLMLFS